MIEVGQDDIDSSVLFTKKVFYRHLDIVKGDV